MGRSEGGIAGFFVASAKDEESADEVRKIVERVCVAKGCSNFAWITDPDIIPDLMQRLQVRYNKYVEGGDADSN